ncbi:DUF6301 family protein [Nocardia sp. NPDC004278]
MSDNEIVDLAEKLRTLVWSWRMDDLLRLVIVFGWQEPQIHSTDRVQFAAALGPDTVDIIGFDGDAVRVEVTVSTQAADTPDSRDNTVAAYARMANVLTESLGEPTAHLNDRVSEIRWAGPRTTLRLIDFHHTVRLQLVTNDWLSASTKKIDNARQPASWDWRIRPGRVKATYDRAGYDEVASAGRH